MDGWITTDWEALAGITLKAVTLYVLLITFTRLAGLRSFAKMSSFDFAATVAVGSILGGTIIAKDPPILQAGFALGLIYVLQITIAHLRTRSQFMSRLTNNEPLLLMEGNRIFHDNLLASRVSEGDLIAKLREANVLNYDQVRAVVFESTGDISVLHGDVDGPTLNDDLLQGVRRRP